MYLPVTVNNELKGTGKEQALAKVWVLSRMKSVGFRKMSGKTAGVRTENVYIRIFENNSFSGLLRSVCWFITEVSGLYIGRIFKGQVFKALT
jgi:hypothetical protein